MVMEVTEMAEMAEVTEMTEMAEVLARALTDYVCASMNAVMCFM